MRDRRWWFVAGAAIVALIFFALQFLNGSSSTRNAPTESTQTQSSSTATEDTKNKSTMPSDAVVRRESLKSATRLLQAAGERPNGMKVEDFLVELGSGSTEGLSRKVVEGVVVPEGSGLETITYQTLVTLNSTLERKGKVSPRLTDAEDLLVVDRDSRTVWIPVQVYSGVESPFYLQMVWSTGGWRLHPFALVQAVRQSAASQTPSS